MAIKTEVYGKYDEKRNIIRTYSDADLQIQKVGTDEVYDSGEVFDVEGAGYEYVEIDKQAYRPYEGVSYDGMV